MEKKKVFTGFIWKLLERGGAQGVSFIVSIVLARLLDPAVYGTIALVTVITTLLQTFVDSGLGTSLIQKKNVDDIDYSSVFYFNIFSSFCLYLVVFLCAPFIADFYNNPELASIIRVQGLILIVSGIKNIQHAYVSKNLMFKKFFGATLFGTVSSAFIGIFMAFNGFGVWALVAQSLVSPIVDTVVLWIIVKWRPKLVFSFERLKLLWKYGWKLLFVSLVDKLNNNVRQLIIGKLYTSQDLAFYNRGTQLPYLVIDSVSVSMDSVLLPTMSAEQDDKESIKRIMKRSLMMGTYVMFPIMIGFCACASSLVKIVLTDKWLPCVPYLQIFCIIYAMNPIFSANNNVYKSLGLSGKYLKLDIIQKVINIVALLCSVWFGVMEMTYALLISSIINQIIVSYPNKKLIGYGCLDQIKDIIPTMLLTAFMGITVYCISLIGMNSYFTLLLQVATGVAVYVIGSIITRNENYNYLLGAIKKIVKK